jgi:hypothetical protein
VKKWDESHVKLALAAADVRDRLRTVDWARLDEASAKLIVWAVRRLGNGLKAREYKPRDVVAK